MRIAILLFTALLCSNATAQFYKGTKLAELANAHLAHTKSPSPDSVVPSTYFVGYSSGLVDAALNLEGVRLCLPSGIEAGQLAAVFAKYISENPKEWHLSSLQLMTKAIRAGYPCSSN